MQPKPYWAIPIQDNAEPLLGLTSEHFQLASPHPYQVLGASYGEYSPFCLRRSVVEALITAQRSLQSSHPQWQLYIFDAYRPVSVQQFMVDYTFTTALKERGLERAQLRSEAEASLWEEVYQLWALPSLAPTTPPPHSTGAAVDLTLYDRQTQQLVDMGSVIDELSPRSQPDYFATVMIDETVSADERKAAAIAHRHRQVLYQVMREAGFQRHPGEWWHFCLGDQMWAWLSQTEERDRVESSQSGQWVARYGRVDDTASQ
jgi:zinc D-Ala-D-Ala dipeptidase